MLLEHEGIYFFLLHPIYIPYSVEGGFDQFVELCNRRMSDCEQNNEGSSLMTFLHLSLSTFRKLAVESLILVQFSQTLHVEIEEK